MDRFQAMKMFTRVVDMNSFSKAAESMELPNASATLIIQKLEAHLNVRLLQRTTRSLSLTPEGADYYERCVRILAEVDETEAAITNTQRSPGGRLRVDMPGFIGRMVVMPHINDFRKRNPGIELMISSGDGNSDLIQEGVDCAIRVGPLQDSTLVARRLASLPTITAASRAYIDKYGEPEDLEELSLHTAVHFFSSATGRVRHMNFTVDGRPFDVKVRGTIAVSDAESYVACGLKGFGLIQPFHFMVKSALETGAMVRILTDHVAPPTLVSAVYPNNRHLAPKVRAFVEWTATLFGNVLSVDPVSEGRAASLPLEMAGSRLQSRRIGMQSASMEQV
jgi:LysR family transcriptional regulator for bpeEF and oprC